VFLVPVAPAHGPARVATLGDHGLLAEVSLSFAWVAAALSNFDSAFVDW
jgi:hypothetical protein